MPSKHAVATCHRNRRRIAGPFREAWEPGALHPQRAHARNPHRLYDGDRILAP
jgi:hypothetical protein